MKNQIKPYPYQTECLEAIDAAVEAGEKRALVVMASGLGKTYTSAFAVERFFADRPFVRVLVLCHSEKILRQTKKKYMGHFGEEFSYGMYVDTDKTTRPTNFLFATFQTMKSNRKNFQKDEFVYIIVDEAHHSKARTFFPTIKYFKPEFLLGLTATPDRLDGQKIEEIYGEPIYNLDFIEATQRGLIAQCDYRLFLDDLSQEDVNAYLQSGEKVSITQLNHTLFMPKRDEEIVRLIREHSAGVENPKIMIFCQTITHAREIAKLMSDEAIMAHNGQSDTANDLALEAFRDGKIRTIISVQMLNEGIDIPDANIIVFLRNTVSQAVFYQQLGRGTRLAPGKDEALILDFVGNCERIQTVLALKQKIDDAKTPPHGNDDINGGPHDSSTDKTARFTLNIATPEFRSRTVDIIDLLERAAAGRGWTKEEIVAGLQKMHAEGKRVTCETINANSDLPSTTTIARKFGSVNNAIKLAGIPVNAEHKTVSHDEMISLGKVMLERGERIEYRTIDANPDLPLARTVIQEFGSLDDFRKACGVAFSREDMLRVGREMVADGEDITIKTVNNNPRLPHYQTILELFGSVIEFATQCGDHRYKPASRESMLRDYWAESKDNGHWLSGEEVTRNKNLLGLKVYYRVFGKEEVVSTLISAAQELYGPIIDEEEIKRKEEGKLRERQVTFAKRYYELCVKEGQWLSSCEFDKQPLIGRKECAKIFSGGVQEMRTFAHELFGDLPNGVLFRNEFGCLPRETDGKMLHSYWEQSQKAGHWLGCQEIDECPVLYSYSRYRERIGGVKKLRQLAIEKYGDFTKEATN